MIKAVFFDIDGTILSHRQHDIPQSTRQAMARLREKGIGCYIASGRHMVEIRRLPTGQLDFDGYVTLNGQISYDGNREVIFHQPYTREVRKPMVELFEKNEISMMLVGQEGMYCNFISEGMKIAHETLSIPLPVVGAYQGENLYQIIIYADEAQAQKYLPALPACRLTRWNPYGLDLVPMTGGKVAGIEEMLRYHGLKREEIMAFGDGDNDDEMLAYAGIGVAMGNGTPNAKAKADYVTKDIEEDGVLYALEHFGIL